MKISRNKPIVVAIAFVLLSTMIATATAYTPTEKRPCVAYVSVAPHTIGLGQSLLINAWVTPQPPLSADINATTFPGYPFAGVFRYGYMLVITKPDQSTETFPNMTSYGDGTIWLNYACDQTGTWKVTFSWPVLMDIVGYDVNGQPIMIQDPWYFAPTPATATWTVQQEPVEITTPTPLPAEYWTRPIPAEYREWAAISGPWLEGHAFNPYTTAPKSAHILWKKETATSGIVGGGELTGPYSWSVSSTRASSPSVELMGKLYMNTRGGFACIDLRTGEELWWAEGSVSCAQITPTGSRYLWRASAAGFTRYDPDTGAQQLSYTTGLSTASVSAFSDMTEGVFYLYTFPPGYGSTQTIGWVAKWNPAKVVGGDWTTGIVWNSTIPVGTSSVPDVWGGVLVFGRQCNRQVAYNATTGAQMWDVWRDQTYGGGPPGSYFIGDGKVYYWYDDRRQWEAFNIYTGASVWNSTPAIPPWGAFATYMPAVAYGMLFTGYYDGYARAHNTTTGETVWEVYSGDTTETPYGTWAFWQYPKAGGEVVFIGTGEHSPTPPVNKGYRLYAIDVYKGDVLWTIAGLFSPTIIAEGCLLAPNGYDGYLYCFGKGQTATTVSASPSVVSKGSSVLIEGTVLDQSPDQPGTPCISKESMTAWMDYLHMQKPCPLDITGVPVTLRAMRSDGTLINLGTTTSDVSGHFAKEWTPPDEDVYKITATFNGDESYWMSWGETGLSAGPTPPEPTEPAVKGDIDQAIDNLTPLFYGIIAAVAVAIIIGIVNLWALRKRK